MKNPRLQQRKKIHKLGTWLRKDKKEKTKLLLEELRADLESVTRRSHAISALWPFGFAAKLTIVVTSTRKTLI